MCVGGGGGGGERGEEEGEREGGRERERQTDIQTDRDRERHRQTDRRRERERERERESLLLKWYDVISSHVISVLCCLCLSESARHVSLVRGMKGEGVFAIVKENTAYLLLQVVLNSV